MTEITAERAKEVLDYDPETGRFTHGRRRPSRYRFGEAATRPDTHGYLNVSIDGRSVKAHRVAWLITHGAWPVSQIDHINGVRDDNRIANLREASYPENGQNRSIQRNNVSGYQGVSWYAARGKWRAQIAKDGRRHQLGTFDTPEEARDAYLSAKAKLHTFQPEQRNMGRSMGRSGRKP